MTLLYRSRPMSAPVCLSQLHTSLRSQEASTEHTWKHTKGSLRAPAANCSAAAGAEADEAGLLQGLRLPIRYANGDLRQYRHVSSWQDCTC